MPHTHLLSRLTRARPRFLFLPLVAALLAAVSVASSGATTTALAAESATAAPTQPGPPASGPGNTDYRWTKMQVAQGGEGANAFYVFAPRGKTLKSLPLAIVMHGYYEFSGYDQMYELVRHTVLAGNVVIYPRWQTSETSPCPGPLNIEPCMDSATAGIKGGLRFLRTHQGWVRPQLKKTSYFGFSFGGIITANLANRWNRLDLPKPRAIFLDDPHDGGLVGFDEPALDDSLAGIPRTTKIECHSGSEGVISEFPKADGSCNTVYPRLTHIPARNKAIVLTHPDDHGQPALSSAHGVCAGGPGEADAYDWNFCWKVWDALRATAYTGRWAKYALGNTPQHTSLGRWSDGVPVRPLVVQKTGPVRS